MSLKGEFFYFFWRGGVGEKMRFDYTVNISQLHKVRPCSTLCETALSQTLTDGATKWKLIYLHPLQL